MKCQACGAATDECLVQSRRGRLGRALPAARTPLCRSHLVEAFLSRLAQHATPLLVVAPVPGPLPGTYAYGFLPLRKARTMLSDTLLDQSLRTVKDSRCECGTPAAASYVSPIDVQWREERSGGGVTWRVMATSASTGLALCGGCLRARIAPLLRAWPSFADGLHAEFTGEGALLPAEV